MQSFVVHLVLGSLQAEVHFNAYYAPKGVRYFVYARSRDGESWPFNMEKQWDGWRIVNAPSVNPLFLENERKLSDAITERSDSNTAAKR
jgi:hypothetical protein